MDRVWRGSGTDQHVLAMQGPTGTWGWHGFRMINTRRPWLPHEV